MQLDRTEIVTVPRLRLSSSTRIAGRGRERAREERRWRGEWTEVQDARQGLCHALGTPYDLKIQRQRRDETRIKKGLKGGRQQLAAVLWREQETTRAGMQLTATVRNGDIDQRNASKGIWVSQALLAQWVSQTHDALEGELNRDLSGEQLLS